MNQGFKRAILLFPGGRLALGVYRRWQRLWATIRYLFVQPVPNLVFVTGANSEYASSLLQLLDSIARHEKEPKVIVFDLGLRTEERQEVARRFPFAELRHFAFERYPAFFDIRVAAGHYAWKPVIIADILDELREPVCWMDSAILLTAPTRRLRQVLAARGFYASLGWERIRDWTHPTTLRYLGVEPELLRKRHLTAACVAANPAFPSVVALIHKWRDCAYVRECIAPPGSSRANHLPEQAVLSVLAHQRGFVAGLSTAPVGFVFGNRPQHVTERRRSGAIG